MWNLTLHVSSEFSQENFKKNNDKQIRIIKD